MNFDVPRDGRSESVSRPFPRVELLVRSGCHLCDEARAVVSRIVGEFDIDFVERDVDAASADAERYGDQVPVLFVDGVQLDFWRVSEPRLRAALSLPGRPLGSAHGPID